MYLHIRRRQNFLSMSSCWQPLCTAWELCIKFTVWYPCPKNVQPRQTTYLSTGLIMQFFARVTHKYNLILVGCYPFVSRKFPDLNRERWRLRSAFKWLARFSLWQLLIRSRNSYTLLAFQIWSISTWSIFSQFSSLTARSIGLFYSVRLLDCSTYGLSEKTTKLWRRRRHLMVCGALTSTRSQLR